MGEKQSVQVFKYKALLSLNFENCTRAEFHYTVLKYTVLKVRRDTFIKTKNKITLNSNILLHLCHSLSKIHLAPRTDYCH